MSLGALKPIARDDRLTAISSRPATVKVLSNDEAPDHEDLTITHWTQGRHGTVTCDQSACTYHSTSPVSTSDTFAYTIADAGGSSTATVQVSIIPPKPQANPDRVTTVFEQHVTVSPLSNDQRPDPADVILAWTRPQHGTVTCTTSSCLYQPAPGFLDHDTFSYTIGDPAGGARSTAQVTILVRPAAPTALPKAAVTHTGQAVSVNVVNGDHDPLGRGLEITSVSHPAHGTVSCGPAECRYLPAAGYHGSDTYSYTIADRAASSLHSAAAVTVTILSPPPPPPPPPPSNGFTAYLVGASGGAQPGRLVKIGGTGCAPDGVVRVDWGGKKLATATADADGRFTAATAIPHTSPGHHPITVTCGTHLATLDLAVVVATSSESPGPATPITVGAVVVSFILLAGLLLDAIRAPGRRRNRRDAESATR